MAEPNWANRSLWTNDNLSVMRGMNSESVDLVYLDPPFNSNRSYAAPIGGKAAGAKFKDTWTLNDVDLAWLGEIADREPSVYEAINATGHTHGKGMKSYLIMMAVRLLEIRRLLKPTGSVWLHCDSTASHYLKVLMDGVFNKGNFRSEIVWQRAHGRAKGSQHESRTIGRDTDFILYYGRSGAHKLNPPTIELTPDEKRKKFPHTDEEGRRYNTDVPLFRQPSMGDRPNLCYTYKGVTNPHSSGWRVSKERLKEMDENGEIIWREGRRPLRKSFLKDYKGKPIGSLWTDIGMAAGSERTDYPTQKPLALLDRIISASTKPDDMVLDPFCGCATTCVSAEVNGRRWVGIDLSEMAVVLVQRRLKANLSLLVLVNVRDEPPKRTDLEKIADYRSQKHKLFGKQEGCCNGCRHEFPFRNFTVDHIIPRAKGGTDHEENLQLLCMACNSLKGIGTHEELLAKLAKPRPAKLRTA